MSRGTAAQNCWTGSSTRNCPVIPRPWSARPQATAFGADAYPDLDTKAAALLHSLARNHALADGNRRLALGALIAFYGVNGRQLALTNNAACDLVMQIATGQLDSASDIAAILEKSAQPVRDTAEQRKQSGSERKSRLMLLPGSGLTGTSRAGPPRARWPGCPARYPGACVEGRPGGEEPQVPEDDPGRPGSALLALVRFAGRPGRRVPGDCCSRRGAARIW
jgi:death on curing protein